MDVSSMMAAPAVKSEPAAAAAAAAAAPAVNSEPAAELPAPSGVAKTPRSEEKKKPVRKPATVAGAPLPDRCHPWRP